MLTHRTTALTAVLSAAALAIGGVLLAPLAQADPPPLPIPAGATEVKGTGSNFKVDGWTNVFDISAGATDVAIWHFVDSGTNSSTPPIATEMKLQFSGGLFTWDPSMGFSLNGGTNNPGWVIITPMDWRLVNGYLLPALNQFNLSGYHKAPGYRDPQLGSLDVAATATLSYTETTIQPVWQKTLQPVWQKTIQPMWQETLQPVWQKTYQPYVAPVYAKDVSYGGPDTLVTRLTYSGTDAKAVPTNGGVFKNGHTWVAVDVAAAGAPGGVWYTIADSSYNANGKKTPSEYNRPITYQYNVQIVGGKLVISFDNRLVSASVGAYVVGTFNVLQGKKVVSDPEAAFPGNAPKHVTVTTGGALAIDMPATTTDGKVYLYTHFEGGSLSWYTTGIYQFKGWQPMPAMTELVSDVWVRNDLVSDLWVRDDVVSDVWVRDDLVSDEWLRDDTVSVLPKTEDITGELAVTVTGPAGAVCTGTLADCGSLSGLAPGTYSVTVAVRGVEQTLTAEVKAGQTADVDFGEIVVTGTDTTVTLDKVYDAPVVLAIQYDDPVVLDKEYLSPEVLPRQYLADIILPAIQLGDAYAIYTN